MRFTTMICAAAMAVCGTIYAQPAVDQIKVHFDTPVMAGDALLPAGDCNIQVIRGSSDNVVLELRSASAPSTGVLLQVNRLTDSDVSTDGHVRVILSRGTKGLQLDQIVMPDQTGYRVID